VDPFKPIAVETHPAAGEFTYNRAGLLDIRAGLPDRFRYANRYGLAQLPSS
jgi:hypothetical protein